ncbi:MAG: penicillin-binding protein activator LpoB [Pedosphaera sp.]|nr:penicillin-binding protein activator LpoB [Pedosphaera sp.]
MIKRPRLVNSFCPSLGIAALLIAGCASNGVKDPSGSKVTEMRPDERGRVAGTGIESQDLVAVADKMARGLLNVPQVAQVPTPPRIVLDPVVNESRFTINKDMFLDRIRISLNQKAAGRMIFLARDRMASLEKERELKRTGAVTSSTDPRVQEFKGADFFLTGKLQSLTTRNSKGVSDYVFYSFQLIDPRTSEIVWEDAAEVKKEGLEDAAYR